MDKNIDNTNDIFKHRFRNGEGDKRILLISEKDQKAYLPYYYTDVRKIYEENQDKYHNIQQVIEDKYIISLEKFKNSSIARFRETYNLMRKKEKKTIFESFDFSLELMFKYELNPIIISACKNLDELDSYLNCLDSNALDNFEYFKVHFEILPLKQNKKP